MKKVLPPEIDDYLLLAPEFCAFARRVNVSLEVLQTISREDNPVKRIYY